MVSDFGIKTKSVNQVTRTLSGGNQQKLLLAKCMNLKPDVLLVNEPTHGVDVGSKAEIYRMLQTFTGNGNAVLLISSELPELLLLSDRIGVMYEGRLVAILNHDEATEELITRLSSGLNT